MILFSSTNTAEDRTANDVLISDCISALAKGDRFCLAELYKLTSVQIYSFALSMLKNSHDAEDVTHDTYMSIIASAESYENRGKPMAWVFTITRNLCLIKLRQRNKNADYCEENWEDTLAVANGLSPEDTAILRVCLEQLSEEELRIVVLHAVSGFKHREIAQLLSLPLPTVLSKYSRSIKKLKKMLADGGTE